MVAMVSMTWTGCLYQDLEVLEVEDFSKVKLSFDGLECRMDVDVYNPNPYAVTVTEADVKLLVKDDLVGEVAVAHTMTRMCAR